MNSRKSAVGASFPLGVYDTGAHRGGGLHTFLPPFFLRPVKEEGGLGDSWCIPYFAHGGKEEETE